MTEPKRRAWLEKLLGTQKAEAVRADTQAATAQLDKLGVERKQMKPMDDEEHEGGKPMMEGEAMPAEAKPEQTPPDEEDKQGDMMQQVGDKLAQTLFDAAEGNLAKLTQAQVASLIAEALRPAVEGEATPAETPAPAPSEEQMTQDTSKSKAPAVAAEGVKALTDMLGQMVKDQGEMAKAYANLVEKVDSAVQDGVEVKALKPVVEALAKQVEALAARLGAAPRTASLAPETQIEGLGSLTPEQAKAIASALTKSNGEVTKKLGIRVKPD